MDGQQEGSESTISADGESAKEPLPRRLERHVARRVVSGFLVLVPLLVTLLILRVAFIYVDPFFRDMVDVVPQLDFSGVGVIITLVMFYVVGAFFAGRRFKAVQDAILSRIPVVRNIYSVARQATDALTSPSGHRFSRVVFVEWPRPGVRALGFVTGHLHSTEEDGSAMVVVYIPTVPNPTSGNLAWVPEEDVIETKISVEEAMKVVFSGGIVLPEEREPRGHQVPAQLDQGPER